MTQLFPKYANSLMRFALALIGLSILGAGCVLGAVVWSPYATRVDEPRRQPVPFSHQHHVGGLGLDCRYCHATVETAAEAGLPPTQTCMNCHSEVWRDSPMLAPVRESWRRRQPLPWVRVYDLPDFVYFNHSVHIAKGVGCETCHGRVDQMPITYEAHMPYMKWCLDCHRNPEPNLRPSSAIYTMGYQPPADQAEAQKHLMQQNHIRQDLMDCDVCHR